MRIAVVHDAVSADAPLDAQDTLAQAEVVTKTLAERGHKVTRIPFSLDLTRVSTALATFCAEVVFNLVEAVEGNGKLAHLAPVLYEHHGLPYTGSGDRALFLTNDKVIMKHLLARGALPTPEWSESTERDQGEFFPGRYIIKAIAEHASIGIEADSVVVAESRQALRQEISRRSETLERPCFAERYIAGREFNVGLLACSPHGFETLPPAEILFPNKLAPDGVHIVGYKAKWDEKSADYTNTPRHFDLPAEDAALLARLQDLTASCGRLFGLGGYVRVDFRVDAEGNPFIIDINANPCLSLDAGFAAAAAQAGIPYPVVLDRILAAALDAKAGCGTHG